MSLEEHTNTSAPKVSLSEMVTLIRSVNSRICEDKFLLIKNPLQITHKLASIWSLFVCPMRECLWNVITDNVWFKLFLRKTREGVFREILFWFLFSFLLYVMHSALVIIPFCEHRMIKTFFSKDAIIMIIFIEENLQESDPWHIGETHVSHMITEFPCEVSCHHLSNSTGLMKSHGTLVFIMRIFSDKRQTYWLVVLINFCHFVSNSLSSFI